MDRKKTWPQSQHEGDGHGTSSDSGVHLNWACHHPPGQETPCDMHFFRQRAIKDGKQTILYDTDDHQISGVSPWHRGRQDLDFSWQHGPIEISKFLTLCDIDPVQASRQFDPRTVLYRRSTFAHEMGDEMIDETANERIQQDNRALIDVQFGRSSARLELRVTPIGLISVGILVSGILLSVPPIIRAATRRRQV